MKAVRGYHAEGLNWEATGLLELDIVSSRVSRPKDDLHDWPKTATTTYITRFDSWYPWGHISGGAFSRETIRPDIVLLPELAAPRGLVPRLKRYAEQLESVNISGIENCFVANSLSKFNDLAGDITINILSTEIYISKLTDLYSLSSWKYKMIDYAIDWIDQAELIPTFSFLPLLILSRYHG